MNALAEDTSDKSSSSEKSIETDFEIKEKFDKESLSDESEISLNGVMAGEAPETSCKGPTTK